MQLQYVAVVAAVCEREPKPRACPAMLHYMQQSPVHEAFSRESVVHSSRIAIAETSFRGRLFINTYDGLFILRFVQNVHTRWGYCMISLLELKLNCNFVSSWGEGTLNYNMVHDVMYVYAKL